VTTHCPHRTRLTGLAVVLAASASVAQEQEWETLQTEPIVVKARNRAAGGGKEIWAEGNIKGEVIDIQEVLTDTTRFTRYMPYMTEARELPPRDADGALYIYLRLDMPVLSPRDFIHKVYIDRDCRQPWTKGSYASHWHAMPYKIPQKDGVVRLTISEGSWLVTPLPNGKSHLIYKFSADPGGNIPSIFTNMNNVKGPVETFAAVEREAAMRATTRLRAAAAAAAASAAAALTGGADAGR